MVNVLYLRFLSKDGKPAETIYEYFVDSTLFAALKTLPRGSLAKIINQNGYNYRDATVELVELKVVDPKDTKATMELLTVDVISHGDITALPLYLVKIRVTPNSVTFSATTNSIEMSKNKTTITNDEKVKEKKSMFEKCFIKGFMFGPATDVKLSLYGPAFKTAEGYVSYDKDNELVEVDGLVLEGSKNLCYVIPVAKKDVAVGDFIMHNGSWTKVLNLTEDGYLRAEKVAEKEVVEIIPTKNVFGFDFYSKLVPLFGDFSFEVSKDNPFGNLPMLMAFGDGNMEDMLPFLLMSGKTEINPMLMYLLMDKSDNKDILPLILMNNIFNKGE